MANLRVGSIRDFPPEKPVCPECPPDAQYRVRSLGAMRTLMAVTQYWDETGNFVVNDPNRTTEDFACSNGHRWQEKY